MKTTIRFISTKEHILHIELIESRENNFTNTNFLVDDASKIVFYESTLFYLSFFIELLFLFLFFSLFFVNFKLRIEFVKHIHDLTKLIEFWILCEHRNSFFFALNEMKSYKLVKMIEFFRDTINSLHQRSHNRRFFSLNDYIHVENVYAQFHDINDTKNSNYEIFFHEIFINVEFFCLEHFFVITSNCFANLTWCCIKFHIKMNQCFFHLHEIIDEIFVHYDLDQ